jgi:hypothetical protein
VSIRIKLDSVSQPLTGHREEDSVNAERSRHEYLIDVPPGLIGEEFALGFRADEALTLWLQDPQGAFVYRDSMASCAWQHEFTATAAGAYKVTITYGLLGGSGSFAVGAAQLPDMATPYLCGSVSGSLLAGGYDYVVRDAPVVGVSDSLIIDAGVTIGFEPGGSFTGDGTAEASPTVGMPLRLVPLDVGKDRGARDSGGAR